MPTRTISIGGATYDLFVRLRDEVTERCSHGESFALPLGEKIRVQEVIETCGGGASNTSVGLSRLGCAAGFCGVVGDDQWGQRLLANLKAEGVDTSTATIVEGEVSSFSIILSGIHGERVILYEQGTNEHLHDVTFNRQKASEVDWVYLNHIQESSCVIQDDILDIISADNAPRFTWNPGGCQIDVGIEARNNRAFLQHANLLLLNKSEAMRFTKSATLEDAMRVLADSGVHAFCITDGGNGTYGWDGSDLHYCPTVAGTTVVDTTGAGDAFGSAATWALLRGKDLQTALRAGTINAASVIAHFGAQAGLLTHTAMHEKFSETHLPVEQRTLS